ncbi:MAG: YncE family protein, partial [Halothiobacillaceae bacterium]|nr:YncE family protein [Halothiobacillaceae bacterium]
MKDKYGFSKTQSCRRSSIRSMLMALMRWGAVLCFACVYGVANAAPFGYISNSEDGTVSVIDLATDAVVKTIAVGDRPLSVAVTRDGSKVYVTDLHNNSITMIDGQNQTVLAKKSVDMTPMTVAVNAAQSRVYVVGNNGANRTKDRLFSVMVLDANTLEPLAQIPLMGKEDAIYMAVSPDDAHVWVSVGEYEVVVIDAASNTVSQEINVQAGGLSPLIFGANPRMAYVGGRGNLITVDTSSNPPKLQKIHMMAGGVTDGLAMNAAGDRAYVAKDGVGLEIYDLASGKRLASVKTGKHPGGVAVHPDGSRIYVVNPVENTVEVVDAKTFTVVGNIPVGKHPIVFGNFIQP